MIDSVRFVSVTVTDIDAAMHFYADVLGFRVVRETPLPGGNRFVMLAPAGGGANLVFSLPLPGHEHAPARNIALGSDDVAGTYADLSAKGVEFPRLPATTPWGGVEAAFVDPYGNTFLLQEGGL